MANTLEMSGKGSAVITAGEDISELGIMIAVGTSDGEAYEASDTASRRVVGICTAVGDEGDDITAERGIFQFSNSSGNAVDDSDIGSDVYVEDSTTVSTSGGSNNIVAGEVIDVNDNGVYVKI